MANDKRYESRYSPGNLVTAACWLAELMCERQAQRRNEALPLRFWKLPHWQKPFKLQLIKANALMKLYGPDAVGAALRRPEGRKIHSLGAAWFDEVVRREHERLTREKSERAAAAAAAQSPSEGGTPSRPAAETRPAFKTKNSLLKKLEGL